MQKSKALKRQAQMRFNAFESYIELSDFDFELSFKHVLVKVLPGSLSGHFFFYWQRRWSFLLVFILCHDLFIFY